jgi:hypothetical protein
VVLKVMADHNLDALVYPMKTLPASRIGGRTAPAPAAAGYRPSQCAEFADGLSEYRHACRVYHTCLRMGARSGGCQ